MNENEHPCSPLTDAQKERLILLIEECSEVQKEATKILRFGYQFVKPSTGITNEISLNHEVGDLECILDLMHVNGDLKLSLTSEGYKAKQEKLPLWTRYQHL